MADDLTFEGFEDAVATGWGGFGVVYRARQVTFDREVAIKVLNVRPGSDLAQELQRECAAIGSLSATARHVRRRLLRSSCVGSQHQPSVVHLRAQGRPVPAGPGPSPGGGGE